MTETKTLEMPPRQAAERETPKGLLAQARHGPQPMPRRLLLYGVQGVGKSTFAASAPGAIFLPTEDGLSDIDCTALPVFRDFSRLIQALRELYKEPHDYQTVVIDSLDALEQLVWADVCEEHQKNSIEDFGYGKGYVFALTRWRQLLRALDALREQRHMASILIAHTKIETFHAPDADSYDRYSPKLHKAAGALVQEWCDEVFFATYKVFLRQRENSNKTRAVGEGERIVRTAERPFCLAKNRLGLPDELPFKWSAYEKHFIGKETA